MHYFNQWSVGQAHITLSVMINRQLSVRTAQLENTRIWRDKPVASHVMLDTLPRWRALLRQVELIVKVSAWNCFWRDFERFAHFLSSPEPKTEAELLWSLTIHRRRHRQSVLPSICPSVRLSVRPFTIFKQHLLLNH